MNKLIQQRIKNIKVLYKNKKHQDWDIEKDNRFIFVFWARDAFIEDFTAISNLGLCATAVRSLCQST